MIVANDEDMEHLVPFLGEGYEEIAAERMQEIADYAILNRIYSRKAALKGRIGQNWKGALFE